MTTRERKRDRLVAALEAHGGEMSTAELIRETGIAGSNISNMLAALALRGQIVKVRHGVYTAKPPHGTPKDGSPEALVAALVGIMKAARALRVAMDAARAAGCPEEQAMAMLDAAMRGDA